MRKNIIKIVTMAMTATMMLSAAPTVFAAEGAVPTEVSAEEVEK